MSNTGQQIPPSEAEAALEKALSWLHMEAPIEVVNEVKLKLWAFVRELRREQPNAVPLALGLVGGYSESEASVTSEEIAANIARNLQDREYATEIAEMVGKQRGRFWECLKEICESRLPKPAPAVERLPALTDTEASCFETCQMPYGKHVGERVEDVPVDYLLFLTECDEFSKSLKRYVKSKRFFNRQED